MSSRGYHQFSFLFFYLIATDCLSSVNKDYHIFYPYTKFGDFRFSRPGDMIAGVETENRPCDPEHASFRSGLASISHALI